MISLWGGALRVLPFSKNLIWAVILLALAFALSGMFLKNLSIGIKLTRENLRFYILISMFFLWCLLTLMWSPIETSLLKTNDLLILLNVLIPSMALLIGSTQNSNLNRNWLAGMILVSAPIFVYISFLFFVAEESVYFTLFEQSKWEGVGGNYLVTSIALSSFFIISFIRCFYYKRYRLMVFGSCILAFWLLLQTGGRSPLIASILSIGLFLLIKLKNRASIGLFALIIFIFSIPLVYAGFFLYENIDLISELIPFLARFEEDFINQDLGELSSIGQRLIFFQLSLDLIAQQPLFGHGVLSWRYLAGIPYGETYPHNIFLDVLCDLGIVGLIIFLTIFFIALKSCFKLMRSSDSMADNACALLFITTSLISLSSGYIYVSILWPYMVLIVLIHTNHDRYINRNKAISLNKSKL